MENECIICLHTSINEDGNINNTAKIECDVCNGFYIHKTCYKNLIKNDKNLRCPICRAHIVNNLDDVEINVDDSSDNSSFTDEEILERIREINRLRNELRYTTFNILNLIFCIIQYIIILCFVAWLISSAIIAFFCLFVDWCNTSDAFAHSVERELFKITISSLILLVLYICTKRDTN